jgi:hypothetical protein
MMIKDARYVDEALNGPMPIYEPQTVALKATSIEMAMGKNPLGITCPNPYPRRKNMPAKKPIPMMGIKFCPNPYPCGFWVPTGFPYPLTST